MKLIIDIPEMAYETYKEWHKNKVATVDQSIIANGIPYEERTQGDLISREALKDFINKYNKHFTTFTDIQVQLIIDLIDHAPTVNTENCEGCPYCPNSNSGIPIGVE